MAATKSALAFGDFQTPRELAQRVWDTINTHDVDLIVEPTVGTGAFLATAPVDAQLVPWVAYDINPEYVRESQCIASGRDLRARIEVADAFDLTAEAFAGLTRDRTVLAIGNPPWVTSAAQRRLAETNLPRKWNRFGLRGLDAMTGKSNFDIAESVLLAVMGALQDARELRLAFLVKRSVAIKMARDILGMPGVIHVSFASIDAQRWFGASVEAGLLQVVLRPSEAETTYRVLLKPELGHEASVVAGMVNGRFVQDVDSYVSSRTVEAENGNRLVWRQGIKHDLARVLELTPAASGALTNGLGEAVDIEPDVLSPLFKSSDVAAGRVARRRFPLFQHDLSGPVPDLERRWPKLGEYLARHRERFAARGSSIYRGKPDYMLFGVGEYSLAPYKVAISGFYKRPRFTVLSPDEHGRPPLVDDTCYLLPFETHAEADAVASYLNGDAVQAFLLSVADITAKRPYTKEILGRIGVPEGLVRPAAQQSLLTAAGLAEVESVVGV